MRCASKCELQWEPLDRTFLVIAPLHSTREYDPGVSTILSKEARSPVIFEVDYNACRQVVPPIFTGGVDGSRTTSMDPLRDAYTPRLMLAVHALMAPNTGLGADLLCGVRHGVL